MYIKLDVRANLLDRGVEGLISLPSYSKVKEYQQAAEKVILFRLLKNGQMQVELCEIPFAGAAEILRETPQMAVFQ